MTVVVDPYPTRTAAPLAMVERREPVIYGDASRPLDPELLASYDETGFLILPAVLPLRRITAMDEHLDALAADPGIRARPGAIYEPGDDTLRSLFGVHELPGPLGDFAHDPFILAAVRQVLGSDVYIHQSRVNLKPSFRGREFYWHSDFETWHAEDGMPEMRAVSVSVLLSENRTCNGPLMAISGSHRWFVPCVGATPQRNHERSLRRQEVGLPSERALAELARRGQIAECTGPVGTCVIFDCNLMHGSNGNITPYPRRNLFLVYNSVENRLLDPFAASAPRPEHIASRASIPV